MTRLMPATWPIVKPIIRICLLLSACNLFGCYHIQLARSPLPVVYLGEEQATEQHTIEMTNPKSSAKTPKKSPSYILENWF